MHIFGIQFEWNEAKAASNQTKHDVGFEEASTVFADPFSVTIPSPDRRPREQRFVTIGQSSNGRTLVVVHVDRNAIIRIISARKAARRERKTYEEA